MHIRTRPACALATLLLAGAAHAEDVGSLAELSLEQLGNIQVTSVGKRLQRLADVAGSVYVIRAQDIRRSGATTLPEVLRLAPNLQVARASATEYAITARSGADVLANKMLVLVDGRTVYSPLFSGVFWEALDLPLLDIDRIEVLSGSGGTLYGSNAVNGVINIITRSAGETQGLLADAGVGTDQKYATVRYGARAGDFAWRAYGKRNLADATQTAGGLTLPNSSQRSQAGFRADRADRRDQLTVQGDLFEQQVAQPAGPRTYRGANLLGRYTQESPSGARLQLQAYADRFVRNAPGAVDDTMDTLDVELQHQSQPRAGHELLWGAGWRWQHDDAANTNPAALRLVPAQRTLNLWNLFLQDEAVIAPATRLTLGLKAEHNSYTGLEWLPNLRLAWEPTPERLVWAAASRAVRAPARIDRDVATGPLLPSPDYVSEVAWVYELGYRMQPAPGATWSATLFHHDFDRLRSFDPAGAVGSFANHYRGRLSGIETWGEWRPREGWRLTAGYVYQAVHYTADAGTAPLPASATQGNDARQRFTLGASWDIGRGKELDLQLRRVGARPEPNVPAYTAVDLRLGWTLRPGVELALVGRNLNDPGHAEWGNGPLRTEVPRSVMLQAILRP